MIMESALLVFAGHIGRLLLIAGEALAPMANQLTAPNPLATDAPRRTVPKGGGSSED
jgi:hypothetical protein